MDEQEEFKERILELLDDPNVIVEKVVIVQYDGEYCTRFTLEHTKDNE